MTQKDQQPPFSPDLGRREDPELLLQDGDLCTLHQLAERALCRIELDGGSFPLPFPEVLDTFKFLRGSFRLIARGPQVETDMEDVFGPMIHRVTRCDLIEDGSLVEAPETLRREAGFRCSVALSRAVWETCVTVPPGVIGQDQAGRLWDILWMLKMAIRSNRQRPNLLLFSLHVRNDNSRHRPVQLKALAGPGDDGELVLTILLPEED